MCPTLEMKGNLVLIDCFTSQFVRSPRKGEVIMASNQSKPGHTIIKRVINTEGELAKFYSYKFDKEIEVEVPEGHIWIEGDNKENSRDSRDNGPLSLSLVVGIARYRVYPFHKFNKL
jgi:signal peptidase I